MNGPIVKKNEVIGLVPARGGSKSVPLKNIAPLGGRPLIEYVVRAALPSRELRAVICSTDHEGIAGQVEKLGVDVYPRPAELSGDNSPVSAVMRHVIDTWAAKTGHYPEIMVLLQPTSPFLLTEHIDACVAALLAAPEADSSQTIAPVPHNYHAFNQRIMENGRVRFRFREERRQAYNKQLKPKFYKFGNLVATRSSAILQGKDAFGDISVGVEIAFPYDMDVDGPDDFAFAEFLLENGKVRLPWAE